MASAGSERARQAEQRAEEARTRFARLEAGEPVSESDVDRAKQAGKEALKQSGEAHERAGRAHRQAAEMHERAAERAVLSGSEQSASEHRAAAAQHRHAADVDDALGEKDRRLADP